MEVRRSTMALKLGKTVLVEIVAILQRGLSQGIDISQQLRDIDLDLSGETVELTQEYSDRRDSDPDNY
jgi:hypothetical protein